MVQIAELFPVAVATFDERVRTIAEPQWDDPTPDDEWSVTDLVRHLVDEHRWAAPLLAGHDYDTAARLVAGARHLPDDGGVGANAAEEWREASTSSVDAAREPGALEREVSLSRGATPASQYLTEMIFDLTVHSWDLQRAIGFDGDIPDQLVAFADDLAQRFGGTESELFKAPVDVPADAAPLDRLVARTGRDPNWTASRRS